MDPLERPSEAFLQLLAIAAAQRQACAVLEEHHVLAVEPGLQLANALDVDDMRAVDAVERVGMQP